MKKTHEKHGYVLTANDRPQHPATQKHIKAEFSSFIRENAKHFPKFEFHIDGSLKTMNMSQIFS